MKLCANEQWQQLLGLSAATTPQGFSVVNVLNGVEGLSRSFSAINSFFSKYAGGLLFSVVFLSCSSLIKIYKMIYLSLYLK